LKEIIPEDSSWSMASVGRMTITLKKKLGPSKWVRLTRNRKKPNNLHYWFEIHEKYSADLEKIKDDDDDDDDRDETEKKTNTTNPNATTPSVTPKKKSKKEKRAERAKGVSVEEEKEKAQEAQWLKTQLAEVDDRVKEKKKEVEEEFRLKKKGIEDAAEKEKEELKSQHAEKVRLIEEKYKTSNPSNLKEEL
jgi:LPS O-antigen subunit length determinant protein (WzzB/FepE family)